MSGAERLRILIVDDAIFMRSMLKDIFPLELFDVVGEAAHGGEAVEKYKELRPDVVTMDIVMPFKSGIEATREIVAYDSQAIVIMCSAMGQEALVLEALEAGAVDFVRKPFKTEEVQRVLHKVLGSRMPQPSVLMNR